MNKREREIFGEIINLVSEMNSLQKDKGSKIKLPKVKAQAEPEKDNTEFVTSKGRLRFTREQMESIGAKPGDLIYTLFDTKTESYVVIPSKSMVRSCSPERYQYLRRTTVEKDGSFRVVAPLNNLTYNVQCDGTSIEFK